MDVDFSDLVPKASPVSFDDLIPRSDPTADPNGQSDVPVVSGANLIGGAKMLGASAGRIGSAMGRGFQEAAGPPSDFTAPTPLGQDEATANAAQYESFPSITTGIGRLFGNVPGVIGGAYRGLQAGAVQTGQELGLPGVGKGVAELMEYPGIEMLGQLGARSAAMRMGHEPYIPPRAAPAAGGIGVPEPLPPSPSVSLAPGGLGATPSPVAAASANNVDGWFLLRDPETGAMNQTKMLERTADGNYIVQQGLRRPTIIDQTGREIGSAPMNYTPPAPQSPIAPAPAGAAPAQGIPPPAPPAAPQAPAPEIVPFRAPPGSAQAEPPVGAKPTVFAEPPVATTTSAPLLDAVISQTERQAAGISDAQASAAVQQVAPTIPPAAGPPNSPGWLAALRSGVMGLLFPNQQPPAPAAAAPDAQTPTPPTATPTPAAAPAPPAVAPAPLPVVTPGGMQVDVVPSVVELAELTASHDAMGYPNPFYPEEMQPRDRTSLPSQVQIQQIAQGLVPQRLGYSPDATTGSPIVGPDGVVESGNGRIAALSQVYTNPAYQQQAELYRAWLTAQGHDITGMQQPVLTSQRVTPLAPDQRRQFAIDANARTTLGMNPVEAARASADRVAPIISLWHGDDAGSAANRDFVRAYMQGLPITEQAALVNPHGGLTPEGERSITNAVVAHAYGTALGPLLDKFLLGQNEGMRGIAGALSDAAGEWAKMRQAVATGRAPRSSDITNALGEALNLVNLARQMHRPVAEIARQADLDRAPLSEMGATLLRALFRNQGLTQATARPRLADRLKAYAIEVQKQAPHADMFGSAPPAAITTWAATASVDAPHAKADFLRFMANPDVTHAPVVEENGTGQQDSPIVPTIPNHMTVARMQVKAPTPAQAKAGNYKMAHIKVGGLSAAIETPMGGQRTGIGEDGKPWSVTMPADYGYLKDSTGADDDHVDAYFGPETHRAPSFPVFLIDQKTTDGSGSFDEHKAMIGFPTAAVAMHVYREAFSDALGEERAGAMTAMSFADFKTWLDKGNTKIARAYQAPKPIPTAAEANAVYGRPLSLLEFLAVGGGVKPAPELHAAGVSRHFLPRLGALVRSGGRTLHDSLKALQLTGYLAPDATIADLVEAMISDARGDTVHSVPDVQRMVTALKNPGGVFDETQRAALVRTLVRRFTEQAGIDLTSQEEAAVLHLAQSGISIPLAVGQVSEVELASALWQAAETELQQAIDVAAATPSAQEGWDTPFTWDGEDGLEAEPRAGEPTDQPGTGPGIDTAGLADRPANQPAAAVEQPARGNGAVPAANTGDQTAGRENGGSGEKPGDQPAVARGIEQGAEGVDRAAEGAAARTDDGSVAAAAEGAAGVDVNNPPPRIRTIQQIVDEDRVSPRRAQVIQHDEIASIGKPITDEERGNRAAGVKPLAHVSQNEPSPFARVPAEQIKPEAFQALAATVSAMSGYRVSIDPINGRFTYSRPDGSIETVDGVSMGGTLIVASMTSPGETGRVLHHEVIHALRTLGLIRPGEWKALEAAVRRYGWLARFDIGTRYADATPETQREEAIAEAFSEWMSRAQPSPKGVIAPAVARVRTFMARLRSALDGDGFTRGEDVFERIESGAAGKRSMAPTRDVTTPEEGREQLRRLGFMTQVDRMRQRDEISPETASAVQAFLAVAPLPFNQVPPTTPLFSRFPVLGLAASAVAAHYADLDDTIRMAVAPLTTGKDDAILMAKEFGNSRRWIRWQENHENKALAAEFKPDQLKAMWVAADAESIALERGLPTKGIGLGTLSQRERDVVTAFQRRASILYATARKLGLHHNDESIPSWAPRIIVNLGVEGREPRLLEDVRTYVTAIARLQDAVLGAYLIRGIEALGQQAGLMTVSIGNKPEGFSHSIGNPLDPMIGITNTANSFRHRSYDTSEETAAAAKRIPPREKEDWFTIGTNKAFHRSVPVGRDKDGKLIRDEHGKVVRKMVPIYIRPDFEGPLRSVIQHPDGRIYKAAMFMKGKFMTAIMYGVAHLGTVATRSLSYDIHLWKATREGAVALQDETTMGRLIAGGLVPIGSRGVFQDFTSMDDNGDLIPGRSWTAHTLAFLPGLVSEKAGTAVKRAVDYGGELLHDRAMWGTIGKLQVGIALRQERKIMAQGASQEWACAVACHEANRAAASIPVEAMSEGVRRKLNTWLFSRSYRAASAGMVKDAVWLPKDLRVVLAALEKKGYKGLTTGKLQRMLFGSAAKRLATYALLTDLLFCYGGGSLPQSLLNIFWLPTYETNSDSYGTRVGNAAVREVAGYGKRALKRAQYIAEHPLAILNLFSTLEAITPMGETDPASPVRHDPEATNKLLIGFEKDGTAIYMRLPVGKTIDDLSGWFMRFDRTIHSILSPYGRAVATVVEKVDPFGRPKFDPDPETPGDFLGMFADIASVIAQGAVPEMALKNVGKLISGDGGAFEAAQIIGGAFGASFSHGHPGGPTEGFKAHEKKRHQFIVQKAMPGIHADIKAGRTDQALRTMVAHPLNFTMAQANSVVRYFLSPQMSPKAFHDLMQSLEPEQRNRIVAPP